VPRSKHKVQLTEMHVRRAQATGHAVNFWDTKAPGLVLRVQPSGHRAFKFVYSRNSDSNWVHLGLINLSDARVLAAKLRFEVAQGRDPIAERQANLRQITFADLHRRYVEEHAKKKNKSWTQADYLVRKNVLPSWGKRDASTITRADTRTLIGKIKASVLCPQMLPANCS
jgi:Arm DNA-binding domain